MQIPYQAIAPETLDNMVEELVTRDGTDYGDLEIPLTQKVAQVKQLLRTGEAVIEYDESLEEVAIVLRDI